MKILDVWSLHYENFIIQIEGEMQDKAFLEAQLTSLWPKKKFLIHVVERGDNGTSNRQTN